jgi:ribonuclease P protein component
MKREAFPKSQRVLCRSDYLRIQSTGVRLRNKHMVGLYVRRSDDNHRLGLVVSRKVGGAVVRNRVKRLFRETYRRLETPPSGFDVVVIARSSAAHARPERLVAHFKSLISGMPAVGGARE